MKATFKSGFYTEFSLDNGGDGSDRETLTIHFMLGDDCGWCVWVNYLVGGQTYEYIDLEMTHKASKSDSWVCRKLVRSAVRDMLMEKVGVKEPLTYLRSDEHAWMDNITDSLFTAEKWRRV